MSDIKGQKIKAVFDKYGYTLSELTPEPLLNLASSGSISRIEVRNIFEGRAPWHFNKEDLKGLKIEDIKGITERYTKSKFPLGLSYDIYRAFLNYEFDITKVSKKDMDTLAMYFKSAGEMTATMWLGFIKEIRTEVYNRDIKKAEAFLEKAWKNMQKFKYKKM